MGEISNLKMKNVKGIALSGVDMINCEIDGAEACCMANTLFSGGKIRGSIKEVNFQETEFHDVDVSLATFEGCNFTRSRLDKEKFKGTRNNFEGVE